MKIEQSSVSLFSSHQKQSEVSESETLQMWDSEEKMPPRVIRPMDRLELSNQFEFLKQSRGMQKLENEFNEVPLDPKIMSIIRALEALTGKKIDLSSYRQIQSSGSAVMPEVSDTPTQNTEQPNTLQQRVGWGINYNYNYHEVQEESLAFSAKGSVKTEDGKSINFSLALGMKNRSEIHESLSFKAGDALIDPLVLNFGADTVSISEIKHKFDLDLDGQSDTFSFVGSGSGFLVLDKNSDEIINDGSELFGPTKGNGFKELAAYDSDKNNWIDENDAIFESLLIWTKDEAGVQNLYTLKDKNVGALYLGNAKTQFSLSDTTQTIEAYLRESSLYLKESGGVGTLQEVDLKI